MNHATLQEPNPFAAGQEAYRKGKDAHKANPYKSHQKEWKRWVCGYQAAQREAVEARPLEQWMEEVQA